VKRNGIADEGAGGHAMAAGVTLRKEETGGSSAPIWKARLAHELSQIRGTKMNCSSMAR